MCELHPDGSSAQFHVVPIWENISGLTVCVCVCVYVCVCLCVCVCVCVCVTQTPPGRYTIIVSLAASVKPVSSAWFEVLVPLAFWMLVREAAAVVAKLVRQ